jgi:hypothetical protein
MGLLDLFKKKENNNVITLWKDKKSGRTRWLAAYSSNYLDDDFPSDILSEKAHIDFIESVQNKELPYPELWLWHLRGTAVGVSDYLFYDKDNGIAMATGYIYDNKENIVKNISKMPVNLGTSHGMTFVKRNKDDAKVIDEYVTIEISILPLVAAANKMTSFYILDEENSMMSTEQKEFLKDSGMSEDDIAKVEARNKQAADENSLRERKSVDEQPQEETVEVAEKQEAQESEQTENVEEEKQAPDEVDDDSKAVTVGQLKSTIDYLLKTVTDRIAEMEQGFNKAINEVASKNSELEKAVNEQSLTPGASLSSIIGKSLIDKSLTKSASGSVELAKEDPLYNDAPAEAPVPPVGDAGIFSSIIRNITGVKN